MDGINQFAGINWFRKVGLEAGFEGAAAVFRTGVSGDGDGGHAAALVLGQVAELAEKGEAVLVGHAEIGDQEIGLDGGEGNEGLAGGGCGGDFSVLAAEHFGNDFQSIGMIIYKQDADAFQRRKVGGHRRGGCFDGGFDAVERFGEGHGEGCAAAFAGAFGGDAAAVEFDEAADDGESNAESAVAAGHGAVGLAELLEDVGEEFAIDSLASVFDGDFDQAAGGAGADGDSAAGGRELGGVAEEVPEDSAVNARRRRTRWDRSRTNGK